MSIVAHQLQCIVLFMNVLCISKFVTFNIAVCRKFDVSQRLEKSITRKVTPPWTHAHAAGL